MERVGVILIRGIVEANQRILDTLEKLRLHKKNRCAVVPNTPSYLGMIQKCKDYTAFGEIDESTFSELLIKRGKLAGNKPLTEEYLKSKGFTLAGFAKDFMEGKKELKDVPGLKQWFGMKPPRGGFERAGIKKPYSVGGAIGYRGKKINDLVRRMV